MDLSTLVQFSKLVADSPTSESVSGLLAKTVVEECDAFHALVFGTGDAGTFKVLTSYGGCGGEVDQLDLEDVASLGELRSAVLKVCKEGGYGLRVFPLIGETQLFGALGVLYAEADPPRASMWAPIEALTELTAISLNKTYQHQRLQKAFDDLNASQEALVRTEKLRALGQMSAGIAHDLKNLLNPLVMYTDHIRDNTKNPDEILDTVQRMDRTLTRGLETVERLREFSRLDPQDTEAEETDLNAMAREALEISKPKLAGTQLVLELGQLPQVLVRPADCVTAIVNLLFNAADAVEGKGRIVVRTVASDGGASIEVEDNGHGIPPEIRTRIIEPLFTTKGSRGTGLGVPIVYAFTQRHGGRLEIESEPGHGAKFTIWLPSANHRRDS